MKSILIVILLTPAFLQAQNEPAQKGIRFEDGLSRAEIMAKAKAENKYVFIDCYATWCGPCKMMDKEVYPGDTVGNYFNQHFISVRVQMDRTKKDNDRIKAWYGDADSIGRQFHILAYPSYLFFTPDGVLADKETGFEPGGKFLATAQAALKPRKVYNDPLAEYDQLKREYRQGHKDYSKMPFMAMNAARLRDTQIVREVVDDYEEYIKTQPDSLIYARKNIEFLGVFLNSKSPVFSLVYPNGEKIDLAMHRPGYAIKMVDRVIAKEEIEPFLKMGTGGPVIFPDNPQLKPEPNWHALYTTIKRKYNKTYAERNLLFAKLRWAQWHKPVDVYVDLFAKYLTKYGTDSSDMQNDFDINQVGWEVFLKSTDRSHLVAATKWMEGVVRRMISRNNAPEISNCADTYANLLYKIGNKDNAIQWEETAVNFAKETQTRSTSSTVAKFEARIEKMKNDKPTWEAN